jgi:glycosyltransferase involved in cell wall biosynthesis
MMPTVSVIMSVYNQETTIAAAIESVIAQTYTDWEFIIIDDCSADRSLEIVRRYARQHDRIRVLKNEHNMGLAASLNKGIKAAQGKYVARMDGDDFSYKERLEKQVAFMKDNPVVDVLGSGAELIAENGETIAYTNLSETHCELVANIYKICPFFHSSVIIRQELLKRFDGYNERLRRGQDFDLWSRMCRKATFHNLQEPLIRYQTNSYKRSLKKILYSQYVLMRSARYSGKILQATFWALLTILKSLLVKAGLYRPRSLRTRA